MVNNVRGWEYNIPQHYVGFIFPHTVGQARTVNSLRNFRFEGFEQKFEGAVANGDRAVFGVIARQTSH